jgi:hypothetical protein
MAAISTWDTLPGLHISGADSIILMVMSPRLIPAMEQDRAETQARSIPQKQGLIVPGMYQDAGIQAPNTEQAIFPMCLIR